MNHDAIIRTLMEGLADAVQEGTSPSAAIEEACTNFEAHVASLSSEDYIHDTPENYVVLSRRFLSDLSHGGTPKVFEASGFPCIVVRNSMLCNLGYIILPPSHPFHGESCTHLTAASIPVHREWTYAKSYEDSANLSKLFETTEPNDNDWVVGFDCNWATDYLPLSGKCTNIFTGELKVYRDVPFVENKLREAAAVLRNITTTNIDDENKNNDDDGDTDTSSDGMGR
mmetsp:Transcript_9446/g.10790  ORF Transcript_9446/g.10790 Transcript_9446/m.10790 type:complete len:227 (+) Transcript_9446:43-723(+)